MKNYSFFRTSLLIFTLYPILVLSQRSLPIDDNLPKGAMGTAINQFIDFINDEVNQADYISNQTVLENKNQLIQKLDELKFLTGGIEFKGIFKSKQSQPNQTILVAEDANYGLWRGIDLRFNNKNDCKIKSIRFRQFPKPLTTNKIDQSTFITQISQKVEQLEKKDLFSGAILIAKGDSVLYTKAVGNASKRFNIPNNLNTKFNLASMGKMFTGVAIMQLVEKNKLKLDDTIEKYIDSTWLSKDIAQQITVYNLLTHTSGLGSYFSDKFFNSSKENFRALNDFKPLIVNDSLRFQPGTKVMYSNSSFALLGVIIEKVSGMSYENYIDTHIYAPSNMTNSGLYEMDHPVKNLAIGYERNKNTVFGWDNNLYRHVIKGGPAGGGYSTIYDLYRFISTLKNGGLLSKNSLSVLWSKPPNIKSPYGLGFHLYEGNNSKQVGHSGGAPGVSGEVIYDIKRDYITVVLSNYNTGEDLSFVIRDLLNKMNFLK